MNPSSTRNQWLDAWRAIAILLVLACHGLVLAPWTWTPAVQTLSGYFGVEIFFCLSGFLIGSIFLQTIQSFAGSPATLAIFEVRRWFRTIPNYYFYVLVNFFFTTLGWTFAKESDLLRSVTFTQNLLSQPPAFFPESWSLAIEEIFYFVLPTTFLCAWLALKRPLRSLLTTLFVILVASMALRLHGAHTATQWDDSVRKVALYRIDSLMWGVLLSIIYKQYLSARKKLTMFVTIPLIMMLGTSIYVVSKGNDWLDHSFYAKFWLFTVTSVGICGVLLVGLRLRVPALLDAFFRPVARVSYSMYLSNLTSLYIVLHYLGRGHDVWSFAVRLCLFLGIVLFMSILSYRYIERPFLRIRDGLFRDERMGQRAAITMNQ